MNPSKVFCQILEQQFSTAASTLENAASNPQKSARNIRNNVDRVNNLIYNLVKSQVDQIEKKIIEILFLGSINQLDASINNFCQLAWQCRALILTLQENRELYLPFLSQEIVDQFSTNYQLFETEVCMLGMRKLINNATNSLLVYLDEQLDALFDYMQNQAKLNELQENYEEVLEENDIYTHLNTLTTFFQCAVGVCDFASTSINLVNEYRENLMLTPSGDSWTVNFDEILTDYNKKNTEIRNKIIELKSLISNRDLNTGVSKENLAIF